MNSIKDVLNLCKVWIYYHCYDWAFVDFASVDMCLINDGNEEDIVVIL